MLWGKEIISHSFMMKFPSYFLVLSLVSLLQRGTWIFSSLPHLHPLSTDSSPWHQAILESTLAFLKDASLCSLLPNLFKCIMCYSNPKIPSAQLTSPHFHPKFFFSLNVWTANPVQPGFSFNQKILNNFYVPGIMPENMYLILSTVQGIVKSNHLPPLKLL